MQSASDEWNPPVKLQQSNSERGLRGMAPNNLPSPRNRICVSCYKEKYFEKLKSFSRSKSVVPGTTNSPQSTTKKPPNHHQKTPTFPKNPCKNPLSRSEKKILEKRKDGGGGGSRTRVRKSFQQRAFMLFPVHFCLVIDA